MMRIAPLLFSVLIAACSSDDSHRSPSDVAPDHSSAVRRAADGYRAWGVVGPHVLWAPELCMAPPPPSVQATRAKALADDGHKLFALYASDAAEYLTSTAVGSVGDFPAGTTLVKEAYEPLAVDSDGVPAPWSVEAQALVTEHGFYPFTEKGETVYGIGARKDLFVMTKLTPGTPGTDAGWVYGTIAPDGTITGAGAVESCVFCHEDAPHDRLFGVRFPD